MSASSSTLSSRWRAYRAHLPLLAALVIVSAILVFFDLRYAQTGFLPIWSVDEYNYHISLLTMRQGLFALNPVQFFAFGFWNYGFCFFFTNLLATLPFLSNPDAAITVIIPRLLTSACAIIGLIYIYRFSLRFLPPLPALLICLIGAALPAFWLNAIVFRPDWILTTFVLASIFHLAKDEGRYSRDFWIAVGLGAAAIGMAKVQAITYLPAILVYACQDVVVSFSGQSVRQAIRRCLVITGTVVSLFVVTNPYLLHPQGARAWWRFFRVNMESNATNNGMGGIVPLSEKLHAVVAAFYFPFWLFVPLLVLAALLAIRYFRPGTLPRVFPAIAIYTLINAAYLLLAVNKAWQVYYLPVLFPLLLLVVFPFRNRSAQAWSFPEALQFVLPPSRQGRRGQQNRHFRLRETASESLGVLGVLAVKNEAQVEFQAKTIPAHAATICLGLLLGGLLWFHLPHYGPALNTAYNANHLVNMVRAQRTSDALVSLLHNQVGRSSSVMVPWDIGFDHPKVGLTFDQISRYDWFAASDLDPEAFQAHNAYLPSAIAKSVRQFHPKDVVIISKEASFLQPQAPSGTSEIVAMQHEASEIYKRLQAGEWGYTLLGETEDLYVYHRRIDLQSSTP